MKLIRQMTQRGYKVRAVSVDRLNDMRESIEDGHRKGLYDEALYKEYLGNFIFTPPDGARSIIVMASRQYPVRFTFTWKGRPVPVIVPPTYLHSEATDRDARDALAEALGPESYTLMPAVLPKKLLAVRSGLASYGRNNITYVEGMGSFHRLSAFFSSMPCEEATWQELKMMGRCEDCGACESECPSGAIGRDRFLLHAERCIVFYNEHPSNLPFPEWISPSWHNSLVGCVLCQNVCPEDRPYVRQFAEGAAFSGDETAMLMEGKPAGEMPADTVKKLEAWDLMGLLDVIPRNLRALLEP